MKLKVILTASYLSIVSRNAIRWKIVFFSIGRLQRSTLNGVSFNLVFCPVAVFSCTRVFHVMNLKSRSIVVTFDRQRFRYCRQNFKLVLNEGDVPLYVVLKVTYSDRVQDEKFHVKEKTSRKERATFVRWNFSVLEEIKYENLSMF